MSAYKRFVSGPKPIGPLTPEEIDDKLTKGRLYYLMTEMILTISIARKTGAKPYVVEVEGVSGLLYSRRYAMLAQLIESEPFDLSKFSYERK